MNVITEPIFSNVSNTQMSMTSSLSEHNCAGMTNQDLASRYDSSTIGLLDTECGILLTCLPVLPMLQELQVLTEFSSSFGT